MQAGSTPPPTIPFALAKAYGVKAIATTIAVKPINPAPPADKAASKAPAAPTPDRIELTARKLSAKLAGLVAAKVDKPAFDQVKPVVAADDALPFYRRPNQINDVATEIAVGRTLDTTG